MGLRIAFAGFNLESVTAVPKPVGLNEFERVCVREQQIVARFRNTNTVPGGCIKVCEEVGADFVPLFHTLLGALGPATDQAIDHYVWELVGGLGRLGRIDGVILFLHGACWAPSHMDVEREMIDSVRSAAPSVPIAVALDYHGNVDKQTLRSADIAVGYRHSPHIDMGETGERATRALLRTIRECRRPGLAVARPGIVIPSILSATALEPLASIIAEARAFEATGDCDVSVMAGFAYADAPNTGMAVVCVDWTGQAAAEEKANRLASRLYENRKAIASALPVLTIGEALADLEARPAAGRPIVLLEHADRMNDSTHLLRALLNRDVGRVNVPFILDAETAAQAHAAGTGAEIIIALGGKSAPETGGPVETKARVLWTGDKTFTVSGSYQHGSLIDLGLTALLQIGRIRVSVVSHFAFAVDGDPFYIFGERPEDYDVILLRSKTHFRAFYEPLVDRILVVDTPDLGPADVRLIPYQQLDTTSLYPWCEDPIQQHAISNSESLDLASLTVEDIQAGFASGAYTAQSLIEACLDRIERYNKKYNAIIFLNPSAVHEAREIDRRRAGGECLGPLAGVPVVVKDTIDMAGFPTTAGWSLLCGKMGGVDLMPERDAPVLARLREAGAVIIGKTNVPILSGSGSHANNSWAGPTLNVVMPDRVPGGSSSGTASAVASAMVVLGLAEETGGSIQNPASAQDLVGIKPTIGLVPNVGVFPASENRDVVGPLARCVRDAAICLDVIAGYTSEDTKTFAAIGKKPKGGYTSKLRADALKSKRLALYGSAWRDQPLSTEADELYGRAKEELEALGAILIEDPFAGSGFADLRRPTLPFANFDARGLESFPYDLHKYLERLGPNAALKTFAEFAKATEKENPFEPPGALWFLSNLPQFAAILANPSQARDISEFIALKQKYLTIFDQVFARYHLDACIFPQMLQELPPLYGNELIRATTVDEINIAGLPVVTVPAGYYASGSPFGLIFVGRMWSEAELLAYAYAYECATRHRNIPTFGK